ncbi:MAG TPA: voltage-gated chloride channel protein [Clostridiales bacterium]|nr:voltage-gated chloride channel protein [Clostridiales bacterium]
MGENGQLISRIVKGISKEYKNILIIGIISIGIGILVGAIDALFGRVLLALTDFRTQHFNLLIIFLPLIGVFIVYTYQRIGKNSAKGMSLIFAAGFEEENVIPKRLIPLVMVSTWLTHLFGGSAGREGVAVQIGGALSHTIGRKIGLQDSSKVFLITGMAAGFAGLFQTPVAAIFFAMEVLVAGSVEYGALFPSIVASFVASYTSHLLGLEKFRVELHSSLGLSLPFAFQMIFLGIIFGVVGGLFAHILAYSKNHFNKRFKNPLLKIFIMGCMLSVLLFLIHHGRYSGLGTNLIQNSFLGEQVYWYDWLLKAAFTILTLAIGYQGGEVTPLFSIGATLGVVLSGFLGLPVQFVAALGYAALFGSATNTILAPIFIGVEVFGYDYLPYFFVVCAIAYVFNGNKSIYGAQRIRK